MNMPPWPQYEQDEIEAVTRVLQSGKVNYWTGSEGKAFEQAFAQYFGVEHAIALANGSVALELALYALGIGAGDEVIVTPRTFIASASSIVMRGATPVFADVDPDSQNITADTIRSQITPKTRAIILVHHAGWPCCMDPILELAAEHHLNIIEDCAQAHAATYKGRPVGVFGDAAAFSFCQDKIMSTGGEGGMLIVRDKAIWERAWAYKDHGKSYDAVFQYKDASGPMFRWLHESFGTNWRMTEMQAAIGRLQLTKLDNWVAKRRANAKILIDCLSQIPALRLPVPERDIEPAYYKFYAFIRSEHLKAGWDQNSIICAINAEGAPCFSGSCSEVYREKAFAKAGLKPAQSLPVTAELGKTSLMFPVHPTLTRANMEKICTAVEKVFAQASISS